MEGDDFDVDFESNDDETYLVSSEDESTEDGDCASDNGIDEGDVNVADSLYGKSKGFAVRKSDSRIREGPEGEKLIVVMDDIVKLQKKYCGNDDNGRQNSEVGDPLPIPGKGAPKKKKNEPKSVRRCGKCNNPSHNARTCSGKHKMPEQGEKPSVDVDSVSISDSVSQNAEKKKRKASGNGERSLQNKSSHPPKDRSANVGMTTPNGIPSTSGHLHPMYGLQPLMPMVHPMVQPMHVRPMYPMYGMSVANFKFVLRSTTTSHEGP
ncbi:hypothetical protein TSUD_186110 [Trifolium subterraneum]|uniref:Uncharacterized protein n=1 Tax=Trifolium subterraneum TaxID=3900 RepID=A0A2Z6PLZ5_TRISU|nr:hypothetical protein TSUD_186110 [Trifolium subterraneum]